MARYGEMWRGDSKDLLSNFFSGNWAYWDRSGFGMAPSMVNV